MAEIVAARSWLTVYRLPPYAHELNPVERVWSQGRGKVVSRAPDLCGCHRERAAARRPAPSSRRRTNRRVALTSAGGEHSACRSEPPRILRRLGEGAGRDHRRSEPTILTLPRPWGPRRWPTGQCSGLGST